MPRLTIVPINKGKKLADVVAIAPHRVLDIVSRLDCEESDVFSDGKYFYSLHLDENGVWCVFQRKSQAAKAKYPRLAFSGPDPDPRVGA